MIALFNDMMRAVENSARNGAHKVLWQASLDLFGFMVGLAGIGLLSASAVLFLRTTVGTGAAVFLVGLALLLLSGGLLALAKRRPSEPAPAQTAKAPDADTGEDLANIGSVAAFTVAFVIARYLNDDKNSGS